MTPARRAFAIHRLQDCPDLAALQRVWASLDREARRDLSVAAVKDRLKEKME